MSSEKEWTVVGGCLAAAAVFFGILAVGALTVCLTCGSWIWGVATGVVNRVVNPDAIVQNYEWYEQQVRDIKALESQISAAKQAVAAFRQDNGDPSTWKMDQREEISRLESNVTGLQQARSQAIQNYNARAAEISRNMWKNSTLPQHIDDN